MLGRERAAPGLPAAPPSPPAAPPPGPTPAPHPRKQGFANRAQAGLASPRVCTLVPPWDLLDESPGPGNFQTWQHITASLDTREGHYLHHTILYLLNLVKPPHIVRACRSRQREMRTQHAWRPRSAKVTDTRPHTAAPRGNFHQRLPRTEIPRTEVGLSAHRACAGMKLHSPARFDHVSCGTTSSDEITYEHLIVAHVCFIGNTCHPYPSTAAAAALERRHRPHLSLCRKTPD